MFDRELVSQVGTEVIVAELELLGAKELAQVLPAFPDSIRPVEEPGTLGNPTMQMVTAEMGTLNSYDSVLDHYASQAPAEREEEQELER